MSDKIGQHINPHVNNLLCDTLEYAKDLKPKHVNTNIKLQETYDILPQNKKKLLDLNDPSIDEINDVTITCNIDLGPLGDVDPCKILEGPINDMIGGLNVLISGINDVLSGVNDVCVFVVKFVDDPDLFGNFVSEVEDIVEDIGEALDPSVVDETLYQQEPTCNTGTDMCSEVNARYEGGDGYKALITPLFLPSPILSIVDLITNIIEDESVGEEILEDNKPLTDIKCYSKINLK